MRAAVAGPAAGVDVGTATMHPAARLLRCGRRVQLAAGSQRAWAVQEPRGEHCRRCCCSPPRYLQCPAGAGPPACETSGPRCCSPATPAGHAVQRRLGGGTAAGVLLAAPKHPTCCLWFGGKAPKQVLAAPSLAAAPGLGAPAHTASLRACRSARHETLQSSAQLRWLGRTTHHERVMHQAALTGAGCALNPALH